MGADGDDAAAVEQRGAIRERDRRGAVDDDERGAIGEDRTQGLLDERFGVHVERREWIVEHEHAWPPDDGTRDREALTLAARQREPLFADAGVETPREVVREAGLRDVERRLDVGVGRVGVADQEVLAHARGEQCRLLEREPDMRRAGCAVTMSRRSCPSRRTVPVVGS